MSAPEEPNFTPDQIARIKEAMASENVHPLRIEAVARRLGGLTLAQEQEAEGDVRG
jgi:hypothetical protein